MKISPYYGVPTVQLALWNTTSGEKERELYLFPAIEKEVERVDSVGHGAPDQGEPVEYHRRFIRVLEKQLVQDIQDDGEDDEGSKAGAQEHPDGLGRALLANIVEDGREEPHGCALEFGEVHGGEWMAMGGWLLVGMKLEVVKPLLRTTELFSRSLNHGPRMPGLASRHK